MFLIVDSTDSKW